MPVDASKREADPVTPIAPLTTSPSAKRRHHHRKKPQPAVALAATADAVPPQVDPLHKEAAPDTFHASSSPASCSSSAVSSAADTLHDDRVDGDRDVHDADEYDHDREDPSVIAVMRAQHYDAKPRVVNVVDDDKTGIDASVATSSTIARLSADHADDLVATASMTSSQDDSMEVTPPTTPLPSDEETALRQTQHSPVAAPSELLSGGSSHSVVDLVAQSRLQLQSPNSILAEQGAYEHAQHLWQRKQSAATITPSSTTTAWVSPFDHGFPSIVRESAAAVATSNRSQGRASPDAAASMTTTRDLPQPFERRSASMPSGMQRPSASKLMNATSASQSHVSSYALPQPRGTSTTSYQCHPRATALHLPSPRALPSPQSPSAAKHVHFHPAMVAMSPSFVSRQQQQQQQQQYVPMYSEYHEQVHEDQQHDRCFRQQYYHGDLMQDYDRYQMMPSFDGEHYGEYIGDSSGHQHQPSTTSGNAYPSTPPSSTRRRRANRRKNNGNHASNTPSPSSSNHMSYTAQSSHHHHHAAPAATTTAHRRFNYDQPPLELWAQHDARLRDMRRASVAVTPVSASSTSTAAMTVQQQSFSLFDRDRFLY